MARRSSDLSVFVPHCIGPLLKQIGQHRSASRTVKGTILFCDVSGFTPMTEALSVLGREGAEELTRVLNGYFTRMIGLLESQGGDVLRFGGDAMTVLFEEPHGARPYEAALEMMEAMSEFGAIATRAGEFTLSMKIGVAHGEVLLGLVGDDAIGRDYYAAGIPLDDSAEAEHHASPGLVVLHPTATEAEGLCGETLPGGFLRLTHLAATPEVPQRPFIPLPPSGLKRLIPTWLAERAGSGALGEHRGTAVVFLSLSGFSWEDLGVHGRIETAFTTIAKAVRRYGGVLNKVDMGDKGAKGILLFGAPHALERKEEMAVRATLEILASPKMPDGISLRAGITSAPLFTGPVGAPSRREFTVMGDGINLAARLMGAAEPGKVLVSRAVREAAQGLAFEELAAIRVKGKAKPVEIFRPLGERAESDAPASGELIARDEILTLLKRNLFGGSLQPVAITGGPGAGKTALARWLYRDAKSRQIPAAFVPLAPFSAEQPHAVWQGVLRQTLGLRRGDGPEALKAARERGLASEETGFRPALNPLLGLPEEITPALKGLSPKERKDLSFAMAERLLQRSGERVLLLDGLQWADPLSLELLAFLLASPEAKPWRLAAFTREETAAISGEAWERGALAPFSDSEARALLVEQRGIYDLPEKVLAWFQGRARGNPGTLLALLEGLDDTGLLIPGPGGKLQVDEDRLFQTAFPDTLEGLYLRQVDALPPETRRALQEAAVLGYSVSKHLLSASTTLTKGQLDAALASLVEAELLRDDSRGERPYFVFPVPLLRDAVYGAIPFAQRRETHRSALRFLLSEGLEQVPSAWPTLAHHAEQADDPEKARHYHRLAGRDALKRYDNQTALRHLEFVCRELSPDAETVEDALSLMDIYGFLGQGGGASALLERISSLDSELSLSHRARLRYFRAQACWQTQKWDEAEVFLKESLALYEQARDIVGIGKTLVNLVGGVYGPTGRFENATECLQKTLALPSGPGQATFRVIAAMNLGAITWQKGDTKAAEPFLRTALRMAWRNELLPQSARVAINLAGLLYETGRFKKAIGVAQRGLDLSTRFANRNLTLQFACTLALCQISSGNLDEAENLATEAVEKARLLGMKYWEGQALQTLIQCRFLNFRLGEGLGLAQEAMVLFRSQGDDRDRLFTMMELARIYEYCERLDLSAKLFSEEGGVAILSALGKQLGLPHAFFLFLGVPDGNSEDDLDSAFLCWHRAGGNSGLDWVDSLKVKHETIPHEVLTRLTYACLSTGQMPPFKSPERLLSLSPAGIWGLRLYGLLYDQKLRNREFRKARLLRGRALRQLYACKSGSPEWAWERIAAFPEIRALLIGPRAALAVADKVKSG